MQKRRLISILLALFCLTLLLTANVFAAESETSGTCGEALTWTLSEDDTLTISGNGPMEDYTSCGPWGTSVKTVIMEAGITRIGNRAFQGCALTTVSIPSSVTEIGNNTFANCTKLQEITLPDSVTSMGTYVFSRATSLTTVTLSAGLESIPDYAFNCCDVLADITIPENVTAIGSNAFFRCYGLIDITLGDQVETLGSGAFMYCTGLSTITFGSGLTTLETNMFASCSALSSVVLGDQLQTISSGAFQNCTALSYIQIPASVTQIAYGAFSKCSALSSICFEGSAPTFGSSVFNRVTAICYYPEDDSSWTEDVMLDYSGTIAWTPYNPDHEHSYETTVTAPTCLARGFTTHICTICGQGYISEFVPAAGHNYQATINAPTCTAQGYTVHTCTACGDRYVDSNVPPVGHNYQPVIVAPTCTAQGYTMHKCTGCGGSYNDSYVDATGHSYDDGVITTQPTAASTGIKTYTCAACGDSYTEELPAIPFTDVAAERFFYTPVLWAVENGITNGMTATTFEPGTNCTRAHVVTFLWRAAGSPEPTITSCNFTDVKTTAFYYKAMLWAVENGITTGMTATTFGPTEPCTRAQVVTFLWRAAGKPTPNSTETAFTDLAEGSSYYTAVLWAVENGITNGMTATTFDPKGVCNRGQVVTFLYRSHTTLGG